MSLTFITSKTRNKAERWAIMIFEISDKFRLVHN